MSYDRLPTTIPMYNDGSHNDNDAENFGSTSASASVSSPNPINQHRHRKRSSTASYGYGGYGYSSYSTYPNSRRRGPSLSPVRTNGPNWTDNIPIPSIPIPVPRFVRRLGTLLLRTPVFYLKKSIRALCRSNSVTVNANSRRVNLRRVKDPLPSILPKIIWTLLSFAFFALLYILLRIYEPHIELAFYSRKFAREEILPVKPLAGCFKRPSRRYNITERLYGARATDVHAGLEMQFGLDCYEFAGTVRNPSPTLSHSSHRPRTQFHTYWRSDLAPFGPRQEYMLKSFFATQNLATSKLVLWSNGDMKENAILREYLKRYGVAEGDQGDMVGSERGSFDVRVADIALLARGTELDPEYHENENEIVSGQNIFPLAHRLLLSDSKAWLDGDLIRLLLLWNFGGVWVDMDFLLTRDLEPLLEHEFVTQWDCYDKKYTPLNGALMRFHVHSPYLCEAFHIMATDAPPRPHSTDWGSTLYLKLYRRLVRGGVRPFKVLPWCFTEGRSCRLDNRLPDPFKEDQKAGLAWWEEQDGRSSERSNWWMPWSWWTLKPRTTGLPEGAVGGNQLTSVDKGVDSRSGSTNTDLAYTGNPPALARALSQVFGIHLHNQWEKNFPKEGWIDRLLLRKYETILEEEHTLLLVPGPGHGNGNLGYRLQGLQGRDVDLSERDLSEIDMDSNPKLEVKEVFGKSELEGDVGLRAGGDNQLDDYGRTMKMDRKRHVDEAVEGSGTPGSRTSIVSYTYTHS